MGRSPYLKLLLGLTLVLLTTQSVADKNAAAATSDGTGVALYTPWPFFQESLRKMLSSYSTTAQQSVPDQLWKSHSLDWHISGISWSTQSAFKVGNKTANSYHLFSKNLKMAITVNKVWVDQIIQRVINGVTLNVHVQAQCEPIQLHQSNAEASATVIYDFSEQAIATQIADLQLHWPAGSWAISTIKCQGPAGLDQQLQDELENELKTAEPLLPTLQAGLEQTLQTNVNLLVQKLKLPTALTVPGAPLPLLLTFKNFQSMPSGLLVFGNLNWAGNNVGQMTPLPLTRVPTQIKDSHVPVILTPTEGWSELIRAELAAAPPSQRLSLNQLPAFQSLLSHRLQQFFAWPDLLKYKKNDPFSAVIQSPTLGKLQWTTTGTLAMELKTSAWIQSVRAGQKWNYLHATTQGSASFIPQLSEGVFKIKAQALPTNLTYTFGEDYIKTFQPSTRISSSVTTKLSQMLQAPLLLSVQLPTLELGPTGTARFNGWQALPDDLIAIPLKVIQ